MSKAPVSSLRESRRVVTRVARLSPAHSARFRREEEEAEEEEEEEEKAAGTARRW